ncbi:MAG TPA: GDSL-type esterase/lipase family protein, partial [Pirellulaceae bacterium]
MSRCLAFCSLCLAILSAPMVATLRADNLRPHDRVVFLGDSITEAGVHPGGYITLLAERVREVLPNSRIELLGAGISGNKVPDLLARLTRDVLDKKPTLVVVYIGINDVWHSERGEGTPRDKYQQGLTQLIKEIQKSGARVVLATPSVIGEKSDGTNPLDAMLDDYAQISRDVAKTLKIPLIDLRAAFLSHLRAENPRQRQEGILTTDGVHLNAAGNRFVADQILAHWGIEDPTPSRLRHVVLFQFHDSATPADIEEVVLAFRNFPTKIDSV